MPSRRNNPRRTNPRRTNAGDPTAGDASAPDSNGPDSNGPDSNAPDSNAPESNGPDSNGPGPTGSCPCGSAEPYRACCGRYHRGEAPAPTAEALMRSRYTAFALRDPVYLIRTWHSSTRPTRLDLGSGRTWVRLQVLGKSGGSLFDREGEVRFRAHYVEDGIPGAQEENSRFVRESGEWLYVGGLAESVGR